MAKKRSGSAATNSVSIASSAPGAANPGVVVGSMVGSKKSGKLGKNGKTYGKRSKTMKLASGVVSSISTPPQ